MKNKILTLRLTSLIIMKTKSNQMVTIPTNCQKLWFTYKKQHKNLPDEVQRNRYSALHWRRRTRNIIGTGWRPNGEYIFPQYLESQVEWCTGQWRWSTIQQKLKIRLSTDLPQDFYTWDHRDFPDGTDYFVDDQTSHVCRIWPTNFCPLFRWSW